ncbi:MAG: chemotaxis protein CheA [Polyangiaceae bacterium]|jgi:two-component system chemotaxis sensor kinase CheA
MGEGGSQDPNDKAREEFFSEAQELIDGLGRDLLAIDEALKGGIVPPDAINDVFRGVHTLKGLTGVFGAGRMAGLSHELEDLLDDVRLGRVPMGSPVLDLLFQSVSLYVRLLAVESGAATDPVLELDDLLTALGQYSHKKPGSRPGSGAQYDLDPSIFGVLTEYEEHRLRSNIQEGIALYRIRVLFPLATIDSALENLKTRAKPLGEIVTYLPTGSSTGVDTIELDILMASRASIGELRAALASAGVTVDAVPKRTSSSAPIPVTPTTPIAGPAAPSESPHSAATTAMPARMEPSSQREAAAVPPGEVPSVPAAAAAPTGHRGSQGPAASRQELSLRSVVQTVRVDIRKLDRLMTIVGELAIVRTALSRLAERSRAGTGDPRELLIELGRLHRAFERHLSQMQSGILEVRMVPLGQAFDKLGRIVRQISRVHGKLVNLVVTGAETEIDKLIVEELSDPLMHMIRNAIDHGIESSDERVHAGKPAAGTIALNAFQKGNQVVLEVEDDGHGMDRDKILSVAIERGMLTPDEARDLSTRDVLSLVFLPGFTTKGEATDLSGRGVGLDVVRTNISKLGGVIDVTSEIGIGTKMTITLPITLAIINVLLVDVSGRLFAIPLANVTEAIVLDEHQVRTVETREMLSIRGASLPICRIASLFGIPRRNRVQPRSFVVITELGERRLGFVVDEVLGQQDIVIKPLGKSLKAVRGFAGATELGDQRLVLVIDAAELIDEVLASGETRLFALAGGHHASALQARGGEA